MSLHTPAFEYRVFLFLLIAATVAFGWILWPFFGPVFWGAVLALLFTPLYRRLLPRLRNSPTLAALATMLIVLVIVILPMTLVTASLITEISTVFEKVRSGEINFSVYVGRIFEALPTWVTNLLERFNLADVGALQQRLAGWLAQGSQLMATQVVSFGQGTFDIVIGFFVMLYLLFFLLRDGASLSHRIKRAIPLEAEHKRSLFGKFTTVVRATVKGNVVIAALQGLLGGLAFWVLGIHGAVLWGVLMAIVSLLPAIGAALIWAPVAIYLIVTGSVIAGIGLTVYGVVVIGLVDNLLRPVLVGKDTRMPDYVVLMSTLGGISVFGINGFVIGPVIAAMFIAVWDIFSKTSAEPSAE